MSYANMILYSAVLPSADQKDQSAGEVINADDPKNKDWFKRMTGK